MSSSGSAANLSNLSKRFGWPDYTVFGIMLAASASIGIFYGISMRKKMTTSEFLMASRSMETFPMAMSLAATVISAIALLGAPAEMYQYGTQYCLIGISYFFVVAATSYLYLPVFFNLQLTSAYEYLQLRFAAPVRFLGSVLFTFQTIIYMAIAVYAPALALSQVTGINVILGCFAIFFICIFYTTLGGMKAVMWTDTLQIFVMVFSMLFVVIKGATLIGGFGQAWTAMDQGSRIEFFNMSLDPRDRHTFWSVLIGGYFTWIAVYGANQSMVQRYLTVPTKKKAQIALWLNGFALLLVLLIGSYAGMEIYARYRDCDPINSKGVKTPDQLLPLFVMETLTDVPGLAGFFVAGIFSGALSTVSSGLNSIAAIALEDFVRHFYSDIKDDTATRVSKYFAMGFGVFSFLLVFVVSQLGGVLQAALSIFGAVGGPLHGLIVLGLFFPWANWKGAFVGTITSLLLMFWLVAGATMSSMSGALVVPKRTFSVAQCPGNLTLPQPNPGQSGGLLELYRVSYIWYSMIATTVAVVVGLIVSFLTGAQDPRTLNPELISPPINTLIQKIFCKKFLRMVKWEIGVNYVPKPISAKTSELNANMLKSGAGEAVQNSVDNIDLSKTANNTETVTTTPNPVDGEKL